ncbi:MULTISPECIES: YdcF family protein [Hansschlegelia]|uniref:YdcF family protein n=1 Tax=Hansschlegelia zhihuaiae TaxID=405005 RepID=A0A4Q0MDK8_9HYPH|nr:YdcF family protein [Hansschlegelia zhihuaiae]RXF71488.1 YdcF family protein [Hansschlegelia zhihuaiae]
MFFVISKLVESLLLPSNIVGVFALFGLVMLVLRRRRLGVGALAVSATLLLAFGWAPVGAAGVLVLENRFPQPRIEEPITGVIMLGGAVDTHISADRRAAALNEGAERLTATAALARLHPQAKIFLSGGANHLLQSQPLTESRIARELLVAIGVPPDRIFSEELSRTTLENGARSAEALKPVSGERWLLVTSASQMPRAVASFRAAGFAVIPYPVDYRTQGSADLSRPTRSISEGLELSDLAAHEWVGLLAYWALGRTNEAFPTADEAIAK